MVVPLPVLVPVIIVFLGLMVQIARSPRFSGKHIPTMALILNDFHNGAGIPLCVAQLRFPAVLCQQISNLRNGESIQIQIIDHFNGFSFIGVDDKIPILVLVIPQQFRGQKNAPGKSVFDRDIHDFRLCVGFLLRCRRKNSEDHLAGLIQCKQVFCLKQHTYRPLQLSQLAHCADRIDCVSRKTGNRLGKPRMCEYA